VKSTESTALESGLPPERSTESVLRAVCLRLGCTAATALFARAESRTVWGRSEADFQFAREQLAVVGEELARRCSDSRKPVATNKLKLHSGGPSGPAVTNLKQAVAIMLSEKRKEKANGGSQDVQRTTEPV